MGAYRLFNRLSSIPRYYLLSMCTFLMLLFHNYWFPLHDRYPWLRWFLWLIMHYRCFNYLFFFFSLFFFLLRLLLWFLFWIFFLPVIRGLNMLRNYFLLFWLYLAYLNYWFSLGSSSFFKRLLVLWCRLRITWWRLLAYFKTGWLRSSLSKHILWWRWWHKMWWSLLNTAVCSLCLFTLHYPWFLLLLCFLRRATSISSV